MAWDEWEELKAQAADSRPTQMQLNQAPAQGPGSGGKADLVVQQDDLGAVGHDAFVLHSELVKKVDIAGAGMNGDHAGSTHQAAAELSKSNFVMGDELMTTLTIWEGQVKAVRQACAHISNHLDFSKKLHANDDAEIAAAIMRRDGSAVPASELDKYFK
ncbi:AG1 protein OS=Streptomyces glaucescens OX=1907 GN=SGLAU_24635 PE=4 SV=1 [Streptomyces glaucescens]